MAERIPLRVNGQAHALEVDPAKPLLYTLRDELGLNNPRFGCGLAQCGACTVLLNGQPVRSCVLPTAAAKNAEITTVAGLGTPEKPHPLQAAYVAEQVPECGYCSNGFMLTAAVLLKTNKSPSDAEIRAALTGLKCRCGVHMAILRAVKRAASSMA
jgi:aerobic-type carbon monoxide dehydrogenase small subunit (CoxS/CutS family)